MAGLSLNHSHFSMEVVIKNTFLEFVGLEETPLRRMRSAPAMLQLPLATCMQMPAAGNDDVGGGSGIQKKQLPLNPCMHMPAAGEHKVAGGTEFQNKYIASRVSKLHSKVELKEEQHKLGLCRPCSYFTFKDDGCHKGDDCEFCHMCSNEGARERRRQIKKELGRKAAFATQAHWNKKKFQNKKPCSNSCCA
eukprot:TRINITY_DN5829_c0_g1_i10.p1 TRINITY_DN5829_c0_g1~~TRINITY_DN5829_c0_g1_i10.p1  ORF type:complete len:192 (+),score=51.51 TRINITY_DN5829_c0_g1_i10:48-623(+)